MLDQVSLADNQIFKGWILSDGSRPSWLKIFSSVFEAIISTFLKNRASLLCNILALFKILFKSPRGSERFAVILSTLSAILLTFSTIGLIFLTVSLISLAQWPEEWFYLSEAWHSSLLLRYLFLPSRFRGFSRIKICCLTDPFDMTIRYFDLNHNDAVGVQFERIDSTDFETWKDNRIPSVKFSPDFEGQSKGMLFCKKTLL